MGQGDINSARDACNRLYEAERVCRGGEASCGTAVRRGNAPLVERLTDRLYRAQQTEAQARQEEDDLKTAIALLKTSPNVEAILDAIVKVGII